MQSMFSLTVLLFLPIVLCQESRAVKTLCEDPYIHAADRLPNNTYRVYRGDYYWELVGLPDRVVKVTGPFEIWYKNMAPIVRDTAIFTVVGGGIDGFTYKYKGERFWVWNKKGVQRSGDVKGWKWSGFPKGGFTAAYNDGELNNNGYPMLIAFSSIYVYYFNTNAEVFRRIGNESGHMNGAFGEKFPSDITAAMPFKSSDSDAKYHVYLFKRHQHCYRPITGEDGCNEWRDNTELFGCSKAGTPKSEGKEPESQQSEALEKPQATNIDEQEDRDDDQDSESGIEHKTTSGGVPRNQISLNEDFVLLLLTLIFVKNF